MFSLDDSRGTIPPIMNPANPPPRYRFLVTAGNTRERIDAVRDWGNVFTGNTGYDIARALATAGETELLTSNRSHLAEVTAGTGAAAGMPFPLRATGFGTHEELKVQLSRLMDRAKYDGVFMTAAVADYRPERVFEVLERRSDPSRGAGHETWVVRDAQAEPGEHAGHAGKVKSTFGQIAVLGGRTEKLVDLFRTAWGHRGLLVKFKLEVGVSPAKLIEIGQASRTASGADYLVANTLDMVQGDEAGAYLLGDAGHEWIPRSQLARRMLTLATSRPTTTSAPRTAAAPRQAT